MMNTVTRPSAVRRLSSAVLLVVGAAVLLALAAPQLWYPLWFDQGAFAACADVLRHGGAMYLNCWDVRGPAVAFAYALPMLLSPSPVAIHAFDLLVQAVTAVLLGLLARDLFRGRVRSGGVIAAVLYWLMYASVNYWATAQAEGFANPFFVLALWAALRATDEGRAMTDDGLPSIFRLSSSVWLVISGACAGVLFWFKYPFVLIGLVPAALILFRARRHKTNRAAPPEAEALAGETPPAKASASSQSHPLVFFALGALAVLLLGLVYFAITGALSNLQSQISYDIVTFNNVSLSYRLEWLRTIFCEEVVAFTSFGNTPTAGFKDTVGQVDLLGRGYPFVFLLMALGLIRGLWRRESRAATLYALGYFAVTVFIDLWQGHFYRYHFVIVLPAMALLAAAGFQRLEARGKKQEAGMRIATPSFLASSFLLLLTILAFAGLSAAMLPWARDAFDNAIAQRKPPETLYLESKLAPYSLVARALNEQTAPTDRVIIFSDVPAVYPLAQRLSGTRFPYLRWAQESGSAEVRDRYAQEFLDDLQSNRPKFFVLTQPDFPWPGADFIGLWKSMPAINQYVEANYHYVGENGPFLLFLRNEP